MKSVGTFLREIRLAAAVQQAKFRSADRDGVRKILFVLGTGRSGTHFLTRCLIGSDEIDDVAGGEENPLLLKTITAAALNSADAGRRLRKAKKVYDALASLVNPSWLVDQSHPNIWFAEHWSRVYPAAQFVGIIRNPYSVVASMLKHPGVRAWALQWQRYPVPNPFLGITEANVAEYAEMSLAERCTLRWVSHCRRLDELARTLGDRVSVLVYENLCRDPHAALSKVANQLAIANAFDVPKVDHSALTRGASMSPEDIAAIQRQLIEADVDERWRRPVW